MSLYTDAASGVLTKASLLAYLNTNKNIDEKSAQNDATYDLTALAVATQEGHARVVLLLLEHGAHADAPSSNNRTPLWILTDRGKGKERALIAEMLLQKGANSKHSDPALKNGSTPLMNEMKQLKNREMIRLLVKADGVTPAAEELGVKLKMTHLLRSPLDITKLRAAIVGNIIAFVQFVLGWANTIGQWVNAIKNRFNIRGWFSGPRVDPINKEVKKPKTKKEFQASTKAFISKYKLEDFFPDGGGRFLENLIKRAMEVQDDPTSRFGKQGKADDLVKLSLYQPVIYCDDSGSMGNPAFESQPNITRMDMQAQLVERISSICTQIVPEDHGVHLRFINTKLENDGLNLNGDKIRAQMAKVMPNNGTDIGTNLRTQILDPLVYKNPNMTRPLLVSIVTDGIPTDNPSTRLQQEMLECQKHLKRRGLSERAVLFQLSQVGNDKSSEQFLTDLRGETNLRNLYVTTEKLDAEYNKLRQNEDHLEAWLLQTLLGPIIDSRPTND